MRRNVILMILGIIIIVGSCDGTNLRRIFRTKRAESDFILRSCIASAQLTRKYRTNDPAQLAAESSNLPKLASASLVLNNSKLKNFHNNKQIRSTRSKARNLVEKSATDTPFGTVDVKPIRKDIPKVFKKKDPLPILQDRNSSARNLDTDAPIIVVQPLHH